MQRITRHIFHSKGELSMPSLLLRPGELRRTALSVPLPRVLPPTFSGTSIRFTYHVLVSWTADVQSLEVPSGPVSGSAGLDASAGPSSEGLSNAAERSTSQILSRQSSTAKQVASQGTQKAAAGLMSAQDTPSTTAALSEFGNVRRPPSRLDGHEASIAPANGRSSSANGAELDEPGAAGQV